MAKFRFQDLEVWKEAIEIGCVLFDIADELEGKKLFRFAEQLRGAGLSMSNNIAEGSGSSSKAEFRNYCNCSDNNCFSMIL
jgi:four helix bundle protein